MKRFAKDLYQKMRVGAKVQNVPKWPRPSPRPQDEGVTVQVYEGARLHFQVYRHLYDVRMYDVRRVRREWPQKASNARDRMEGNVRECRGDDEAFQCTMPAGIPM